MDFHALFISALQAGREVFDTEKLLIGVIIGLIGVIYGILWSRISKMEELAPTIYEIKAGVEFIKKNCPRCNQKE